MLSEPPFAWLAGTRDLPLMEAGLGQRMAERRPRTFVPSLRRVAGQELEPVWPELAIRGNVTVQGLASDPELTAKSTDLGIGATHGRCGQAELGWCHLERPAALPASGTGRGETGDGAFRNELSLELGQGGEDPEDQLA